MEIYGNTEGLKKTISAKYNALVKEEENALNEKVKEIEAKANEEAEYILEQAKTDAEAAAREAKQRVLNEEKLKAKKEFEQAREEMILKVLEEVKKQAKKVSESAEYLKFVKKNAPKGKSEVYGGSPKFKKAFSKMKLDKNLLGVKFETENLVYDLSLNGMIEAQEESIRRTITENIFK